MSWQIENHDFHFLTNFRYSKYILSYKICSLVSKAQYLHHTSTAKKALKMNLLTARSQTFILEMLTMLKKKLKILSFKK